MSFSIALVENVRALHNALWERILSLGTSYELETHMYDWGRGRERIAAVMRGKGTELRWGIGKKSTARRREREVRKHFSSSAWKRKSDSENDTYRSGSEKDTDIGP